MSSPPPPPIEWIWNEENRRYYSVVTQPDGRTTSIWAPQQVSQGSSSNTGALGVADGTDMSFDKPEFEFEEQDSDDEEVDPSYYHIGPEDEWDFFVPGKVFKALTIQEVKLVNGPAAQSLIRYGDVYKKVYRFIVTKAVSREHWSHCLRISTHGGRACTKPGLDQRKHTIVYTGAQPPDKLPGENRLNKEPIRIIPIDQSEKLDPLSRVNLAKTYPIEHNIRVKEVGRVSQADLKKLQTYCRECK